ncbi:DUF3616 domain-containing protein [Nonomuraea sp. NBC_01738]|uniref:DUF3616 domain-containing protein n=1 Tax=Nonomuraea sp. NBC_01738 TaxID=2976003 RepID=UPI002E12040D|nr:DUF3616 domain-containing protein [Nonomuraea sp. NBC_01738]
MTQVELRFHPDSHENGTPANLSAVRSDATGLWVAGDETATIEHLTWTGALFDAQRTFRLADYVDLPAGPDDEADIEGLARSDGHLWLTGSHSLKRRKIKSRDPEKAAKRLASVVREENRFILVRLPLDPVTSSPLPGEIMAGRDNLTAHLAGDEHLDPFLALPGKDNGLDVEGIAVLGSRVYLGLRGPVLRGWAVVLEVRPEPTARGKLGLAEPYRKHFLDLGGLGVRDLCPHGDDLLLLTGPTMDLDGPVRVVRWRVGQDRDVVGADALDVVAELPHGAGDDHAEGLAELPDGRLLVVYDSPAKARVTPEGGVYADVISV